MLQRLAVEQLHDEERRAVVLADVVESTDVRVGQLGDGPRFTVEPFAELRTGGECGRQDLDGDGAIEPRVTGFEHLAHATGADRREDLVGAEAWAGGRAKLTWNIMGGTAVLRQ